jgi:hypothetical protein
LHIRGFAMTDGVSFTNGKHRYTGRCLSNGENDIQPGGSWFWRFSFRQKIAVFALFCLTCLDYGWKDFDDIWFLAGILLIAPIAIRLPGSQRKYHGAEHMAVNLFEGQPPSVFHPGCGSNLILMLLPGLFLELLPWGVGFTLLCEAIYVVVVLRILWPAFQHGLRQGRPIAGIWWRFSRWWQRFFVAEPNDDELQLALQTLAKLLKEEQ